MNEIKKPEPFFDIKGISTGQPLTKKTGIHLIIAAAIFIIVQLLPLDFISPVAAKTLALLLTIIWMWLTNCISLGATCIFLVVAGMLMGLFHFGQFSASFGSSPFSMMIGMLIVSTGASNTNIAKRVAYLFLSKMGRSPSLILFAICAATAVVSAFVSNLGTTIVMSAISISIMEEMGEIKGESGLGKAIMIGIPIFSMIGGMALITGSPSTNMMGISMVESATNGAHTVTYNQWAIIGVICSILLIIPVWLIYKFCFKVKDKSDKNIDIESFKLKLEELGPLRGAELRWVLIVIFMVGSMIVGLLNTPTAALLCGLLSICPGIGFISPKKALSNLPIDVLLLIGFTPVIADMINSSLLGEWMVNNLFGWTAGLPVFVIMLILALAMTVLINVAANATLGIIAVVIAAFTPMVVAYGLNPSIVLLPAMYLGSFTTVLGVQTNVVLTYHHGYWNMKDPIRPGIYAAILITLVTTVVAYIVGPLIGMPLYL